MIGRDFTETPGGEQLYNMKNPTFEINKKQMLVTDES